MRRYILTGAPGCGKTSILQALHQQGYAVVGEAATDVIAAAQAQGCDEPWADPAFPDSIVALQRHRQQQPAQPAPAQVFDRSPVCTLALAHYLGHPLTPARTAEIETIIGEGRYEPRVFFIRPIGFCAPTPARRISYQDSLAFERFHETEYQRLGFQLTDIPPAPLTDRAAMISDLIRSWA